LIKIEREINYIGRISIGLI